MKEPWGWRLLQHGVTLISDSSSSHSTSLDGRHRVSHAHRSHTVITLGLDAIGLVDQVVKIPKLTVRHLIPAPVLMLVDLLLKLIEN